jgi:hypothetical protein
MALLRAKWTEDQVRSLNAYQQSAALHPFTCNNGHALVAGADGWTCHVCAHYKQDWCHDFMTNWGWRDWSIKGSIGKSEA